MWECAWEHQAIENCIVTVVLPGTCYWRITTSGYCFLNWFQYGYQLDNKNFQYVFCHNYRNLLYVCE
jgi:hypothetical protein